MRYPQLLKKGDIIGICAPSGGVADKVQHVRLDNAIANVRMLGYDVLETASVRHSAKCVSADSAARAAEFMDLYENPDVMAIIPPWGGEFLMDMLPHLDFDRLTQLPPKWVCGFSDISTLTFPLTVKCGIATVHGSNFMSFGHAFIHLSDLAAFEVMSKRETTLHSSEFYGGFTSWTDFSRGLYSLDKESRWKALNKEKELYFEGRMIGGCMDTICKLIGTSYAPIADFLEKYRKDGFIWTLESCEMRAADIYRTLWQMEQCGWFKYCKGMIYGRPDGYSDNRDFTLTDALKGALGHLDIPVIYDADIGHVPPQIQIINGAWAVVDFKNGKATIKQMQE